MGRGHSNRSSIDAAAAASSNSANGGSASSSPAGDGTPMNASAYGKRKNSLSASFTAAHVSGADDTFAMISFGHPLLDILSSRDHEFLKRYNIVHGSSNLVKEEQLPIFEDLANSPVVSEEAAGEGEGGEDKLGTVRYVAGGAAMNSARIVRWLLRGRCMAMKARGENPRPANPLHCSGSRTAMVGATGTDQFEGYLLQSLRSETVEHCFFRKDGFPTGTCAVLVVDGERSLLANLGAATKLTREDIIDAPSVMAAFSSTKAVYMEGFFMNLVDRETCAYVSEQCTAQQKLFAFNLSAPYLCNIFPESLKKVLPHVDVVFGSRIDAVAYAKSVGWECASEEEEKKEGHDVLPAVVAQLAKMPRAPGERYTTDKLLYSSSKNVLGPAAAAQAARSDETPRRLVVITDGASATLVGIGMGEDAEPTVKTFQPDRIDASKIIDSNGAGDAFSGGFMSGLLLRRPIEECVALGHKSANVILRHSGCTFPENPPFEV